MRGGDYLIRAKQRSAGNSRVQPVERVHGFASAIACNRRDLLATPDTGAGEGLFGPFGDALAGLSAALEKDQVLQTLAETPLMLDVMSLAYRDLPTEELTSEKLNTEKERRSHLFDTYIDKMFIRKGKGAQEYAREQTLRWLSWLASGMQQHGQTVFLIEQLQPSWLARRAL